MACGCSKNRAGVSGTATVSGTYRVLVGGRQVYESSSQEAADLIAGRFKDAGTAVEILAPGTPNP